MILVATTVESCQLLPSLQLSLLDFYLFSYMSSGPFSFGAPGPQPSAATALSQQQLAFGSPSPPRSTSQYQTGLSNYTGGPLRPAPSQLSNAGAGSVGETGLHTVSLHDGEQIMPETGSRTVSLNDDEQIMPPTTESNQDGSIGTQDPPVHDFVSKDSAGLALFVDAVANNYGFTGRDMRFRESLHGFIQVSRDCSFI